MRVSLVIPTRNAASYLPSFLDAISRQDIHLSEVIAIDSSSTDGTPDILRAWGATVLSIPVDDFNHGGTRRFAMSLVTGEFCVLMTQDAILDDPSALRQLMSAFHGDPKIAAVFGRQLPSDDANPIATHHRLFNYPDRSRTMSMSDADQHGLRTCWLSNSFAAYRSSALAEVGNFSEDLLCCEDVHVAARLLLAGYKTRYVPTARVRHSHNYTIVQEFRRYFDNGVFYGKHGWIKKEFGGARGEGMKFVLSEARYLIDQKKPHYIPGALARNVAKMVGFKLGKSSRSFPLQVCKRLSMTPRYWQN